MKANKNEPFLIENDHNRKIFFCIFIKIGCFCKGTTWFYRVYNSSLRGSFPKFANPIWNGFRTHHKLRFINCQTD